MKREKLLQWASTFADYKMVKQQDFSDGVCFSMILKAIHPKFPILKTETYVQYRIKNLEALRTAMVKHQVNIDFDIEKIAWRDQEAALNFLSDLYSHYKSVRGLPIVKKKPPPTAPRQPSPCLIQFNHPQLTSKKQNFFQGQPVAYGPQSQSIPVQIQGTLSFCPSQFQFQPQPLTQFQERFATQAPAVSPNRPLQPPTPTIQIFTPFRVVYENNSQQQEYQRKNITPIQSQRVAQFGTQSRGHVQFQDENQAPMPQQVFATPYQMKLQCFGQGQMMHISPKQNDRDPPQFFQQLDQQSQALINEFNKMNTSCNKQVQKDSIRKIIKDIIMEGKGLTPANIQIQIIDAISGPEDQDLLQIKEWLLSQMHGQVMVRDQGTQNHPINSYGSPAQQSQLLPGQQQKMEQLPQGQIGNSSPSFANSSQIQNQMQQQQIASLAVISQSQSQDQQMVVGSQGSKSRQNY